MNVGAPGGSQLPCCLSSEISNALRIVRYCWDMYSIHWPRERKHPAGLTGRRGTVGRPFPLPILIQAGVDIRADLYDACRPSLWPTECLSTGHRHDTVTCGPFGAGCVGSVTKTVALVRGRCRPPSEVEDEAASPVLRTLSKCRSGGSWLLELSD
jgi:hypothetical protein